MKAKKSSCPVCGHQPTERSQRKTHKQFVSELKKVSSTIKVIGQYAGDTPIQVNCRDCLHEWSAVPSYLLQGKGCPVCRFWELGNF